MEGIKRLIREVNFNEYYIRAFELFDESLVIKVFTKNGVFVGYSLSASREEVLDLNDGLDALFEQIKADILNNRLITKEPNQFRMPSVK